MAWDTLLLKDKPSDPSFGILERELLVLPNEEPDPMQLNPSISVQGLAFRVILSIEHS